MTYIFLPMLAIAIVLLLLNLLLNRKELLKVIKDRDESLDAATRQVVEMETNMQSMLIQAQEASQNAMEAGIKLQEQLNKNTEILSQKKSSETRLGQISEHLIPFLEECPYDPKNMHFMGNPIDYLIFDFDEGSITFLEVKSGNSKPSKRQKMIKNMIKDGHVYYNEIRINEKGVKAKVVENNA